ncbi:tyrosine-type recombinase/integrase [Paenarthrobacter ureafaciens]|uniref:tyrosine-type recombinase/integrase n=1 Tax=Paenarthrobacter ureafaciens TaxID=37931 RepID=UPI00140DB8A9|nr:site-specific integrase [Paenarthrobacter ureafaciens]MCX8453712.1 site-specific integrase [Paenarthrobacter ureafaciens]MCY0973371.1 site-specific integrase [Paenarthrobacter ureafaciens]
MASISTRPKKDGSQSFMVRWRDPKTGKAQGLTFVSHSEAETLKRLLDANGQNFEVAQHAILENAKRVPTVAEVIQEHIDLLVRPSSGTVKTYQTMLDLHVKKVIGGLPVDKLDYRAIAFWVKSMMAKGRSPKTIKNVHGLISASMNTAEMLGYITRNPCRGVQLPSVEKAEDEMMFLTHAEFGLIMENMGERYRDFTNFLVMTGTRFGEATALSVADIDLLGKPATARINKAWKRDGQNQFYIGPTKTGAGKRTIGLNPALVDLLIPLVAGRPSSDLLFTTPKGERIVHKLYWHHFWVPAVKAAQLRGLRKDPRIHDLRHTHASWLIQDGVPIFTISRRLGHASIKTTEQVYGHLMPEALQVGADATERQVAAFMR